MAKQRSGVNFIPPYVGSKRKSTRSPVAKQMGTGKARMTNIKRTRKTK